MPSALFIGGYADGQWIDVPDRVERHVVNEYGNHSVFDCETRPHGTEHITQHVYRVDSLRAGDDRWRVFVPVQTEPREWISALLKNYQSPPRRESRTSDDS